MSAPSDAPDWSRLPHDPVGFFGLSEGFERRELKQRYNELIRRFKPEKHPEEFRRIRAAFEQLDVDLRYGRPVGPPAHPEAGYRWVADAQQPGAEMAAAGTAPPRGPAAGGRSSPPLHERLRAEPPGDIYRELAAKKGKTTFEFYVLAVLSDIVDRKDGLQFPRWLIKGLEAHPNDLGLLRLLQAYLSGPVPSPAVERLLVACSQVVPEDAFFPFTEPLWQALLRAEDFPRFRAALQHCEAKLRGLSIDGRIAFYLQILKPALWQADEPWVDEAMKLLEENFERIPHFLEYDLEIIAMLRAYMRHRETFTAGHPLRQRLDAALQAYFCQEQAVGDRRVLECQMRILQDVSRLCEALSDFSDPAYGPFYGLWGWISYDVAERQTDNAEPLSQPEIWQHRTRMLLQQMGQQTKASNLGQLWTLSSFAYLFVRVLAYAVFVLGLAVLAEEIIPRGISRTDWLWLSAMFGSMVGGAAVAYWLNRKLAQWLWLPWCLRMSARCYRRIWQREALNFLARSHVPHRVFLAFVDAEASDDIPHATWVRHYVQQDFALAVYSVAQRFVV